MCVFLYAHMTNLKEIHLLHVCFSMGILLKYSYKDSFCSTIPPRLWVKEQDFHFLEFGHQLSCSACTWLEHNPQTQNLCTLNKELGLV